MTRLDSRKAERIVKRFAGKRIGILGDFMLDELIQGTAARISPEAPVPVVLLDEKSRPEIFPGGAGNVAANLASLGARPVPFGVVGRDETGRQIHLLLRGLTSSTSGLIQESRRITPRKTRIVAHQQQLLRIDQEAPKRISSASRTKLVRSLSTALRRLDALVISDYNKGTVSAELLGNALAQARRKRVPTFVDLKPENTEGCRGATLVTPNLHEAEQMAGFAIRDARTLARAGKRLLALFACGYLLITQGGEGMTLFAGNGETSHISTQTQPVYDVTGAGDTVIATLAAAYGAGASMTEAAQLANLAGLAAVLKFGTARVSRLELLDFAARSLD